MKTAQKTIGISRLEVMFRFIGRTFKLKKMIPTKCHHSQQLQMLYFIAPLVFSAFGFSTVNLTAKSK